MQNLAAAPTTSSTTPAATTAEPPIPWGTVLWNFLASRALILVLARLSVSIIPSGRLSIVRTDWLGLLRHWDADWYIDLARDGYFHTAEKSNAVFFPFFPALIRSLASLGLDLWVSGYVVSNLALVFACGLLWKLTRLETRSDATATLAVQFLLFAPMTFFFSAVYSESLFLLCALGALYGARRSRWVEAGLFGFFAATTRAVGFALVVPLLWEFYRQNRPNLSKPDRSTLRRALPCLLPLGGASFYMGLMWVQFGQPLLYFEAQHQWGRKFTYAGRFLTKSEYFLTLPFFQLWFAAAIGLAFFLMLAGVFLRLRHTYVIFSLTLSFIYFSSRLVESIPRYLSVVFPFYIIAALLATRFPQLRLPAFAFSVSALSMAVILFVNGYWLT